jgi:hypothetical protein
LNESPALPELLVPPLPEKFIVSGFIDHKLLGVLIDARPTAAYAPTITRLIKTPTRR